MRKVVLVVIGVVVVGAVAGSVLRPRGADPRVEGGVVEMEQALPDLTGIETVSGEPLPSGALTGPATVINVWADWCVPCLAEQPALQEVHRRYDDRGVGFLGINYRDDRAAAERWIEDFGVSYPSIYDPDGRTAALLDFPFLPDTYVVDGTGTIRFAIYGETDEDELSGLIDQVLGASAPAAG